MSKMVLGIPGSFESNYEKGMTYKELMELYNVNSATINRWVRGLGIRRNVRFKRNRTNPDPSRDELYKEYISNKKTRKELAQHYDVSISTVQKWLSEFKIVKTPK